MTLADFAHLSGSFHKASEISRCRDWQPAAETDADGSPAYRHLAAWKGHAGKFRLLDPEFILPAIVKPVEIEEFPFMTRRRVAVDPEVLQDRVQALRPWSYHVDFGHTTTAAFGSYNDTTMAFHRYRSALISATVAELLGEELKSASVLDVACNCGVFSLDLADRGAAHVTGFDLIEHNIEQARFLADTFGFSNVQFSVANIKDLRESGTFDVVLNLGLMYLLSTPFEVLRRCFELTEQFCVIDTICHTEPLAAYHVVPRQNSISGLEGDVAFQLQPTYRAVVDTIRLAGFEHVVEVIGACQTSIDLYDRFTRRCFVAFKSDPLPYIARWEAAARRTNALR